MSGDVRGELAEALAAALPESLGPVGLRRPAIPALGVDWSLTGFGMDLIEALLPVVERIAREAAAEALRKVADELESRHAALNVLGAGATRLNDLLAVEDYIRARADAALGGDR